ncbi:lysophospholipid acyltransferase family protein [Nocardia pseudobrasiliensis]|uniref:1-acyl-sn-glycerol-3-phosphate acyltransferase n=1 Tax=Nocardia pseudobrasiliensis TaxID=45979 RepID=A0A370HXK4_9NOCA|nr:lysophospholipid acyltransferase family protein [Nocardia pseudobrasiliensis]RDI61674.1 1-acyl-sn-glycerol-3-phosphate acyltransferase [Nocardia pseudobrasiliensis]
MEPVYRTIIGLARTVFFVQGLKFDVKGAENVPAEGGAVIAINHTGYMDFTYAGLPARTPKRYIRFMAKKEVFDDKISGPIMRALKHIPVDRSAGADSYKAAVDYLRRGELVGVYPEATISRSFEIKEFKSGAARMAIEAGVPIVPMVIWGAQRVWTKGYPKRLGRTNTPIAIAVGEPIQPPVVESGGSIAEPAAELSRELRSVMQDLLLELQKDYVHEPGAYWVPARLGGAAPTLEQADAMDAAEAAEKAAKRRSDAAEQ